MSKQINWLINNFYGVLDISGNKTSIVRRSKVAGAYSDDVSTETTKNLKKSTAKVGNAMRRALTKTV